MFRRQEYAHLNIHANWGWFLTRVVPPWLRLFIFWQFYLPERLDHIKGYLLRPLLPALLEQGRDALPLLAAGSWDPATEFRRFRWQKPTRSQWIAFKRRALRQWMQLASTYHWLDKPAPDLFQEDFISFHRKRIGAPARFSPEQVVMVFLNNYWFYTRAHHLRHCKEIFQRAPLVPLDHIFPEGKPFQEEPHVGIDDWNLIFFFQCGQDYLLAAGGDNWKETEAICHLGIPPADPLLHGTIMFIHLKRRREEDPEIQQTILHEKRHIVDAILQRYSQESSLVRMLKTEIIAYATEGISGEEIIKKLTSPGIYRDRLLDPNLLAKTKVDYPMAAEAYAQWVEKMVGVAIAMRQVGLSSWANLLAMTPVHHWPRLYRDWQHYWPT